MLPKLGKQYHKLLHVKFAYLTLLTTVSEYSFLLIIEWHSPGPEVALGITIHLFVSSTEPRSKAGTSFQTFISLSPGVRFNFTKYKGGLNHRIPFHS